MFKWIKNKIMGWVREEFTPISEFKKLYEGDFHIVNDMAYLNYNTIKKEVWADPTLCGLVNAPNPDHFSYGTRVATTKFVIDSIKDFSSDKTIQFRLIDKSNIDNREKPEINNVQIIELINLIKNECNLQIVICRQKVFFTFVESYYFDDGKLILNYKMNPTDDRCCSAMFNINGELINFSDGL